MVDIYTSTSYPSYPSHGRADPGRFRHTTTLRLPTPHYSLVHRVTHKHPKCSQDSTPHPPPHRSSRREYTFRLPLRRAFPAFVRTLYILQCSVSDSPSLRMNCPSRVDPDALEKGWNQSPNSLALHKNDDLNSRANLTQQRDHRIPLEQPPDNAIDQDGGDYEVSQKDAKTAGVEESRHVRGQSPSQPTPLELEQPHNEKTGRSLERELAGTGQPRAQSERDDASSKTEESRESSDPKKPKKYAQALREKLAKYVRFVGPGFLVSVAYIDPGTTPCY